MRYQDLFDFKRAKPFRPFRIVMNDGHSYDVRHPDFVAVGRRTGIFYHKEAADAPYDRWETFSLTLISRIFPIEAEDEPGESRGDSQTPEPVR